jgi:chemotaxis signal transduction protein
MGNIDWAYARQVLHATEVALEQPIEGAPEQIAGVYSERTKKLVLAPGPTGFEAATVPVVVFRLGEERYGIELADVSAVLGTMPSTSVPESEAKLEGLINVNGTVRPVLNLRFLLDLPVAGPNTPEYFLLLRQKQQELGIKVEAIECVCHLSPQDLDTAEGDPGAPCLRGFTSATLTVLRTKALFAEFWSERSES